MVGVTWLVLVVVYAFSYAIYFTSWNHSGFFTFGAHVNGFFGASLAAFPTVIISTIVIIAKEGDAPFVVLGC